MYPTPTAGCVEGGEQSSRIEMTEKGGFILRKKNKPEMTEKLSDNAILGEDVSNSKSKGSFSTNKSKPSSGTNNGEKKNWSEIWSYASRCNELEKQLYNTPTANDAKNLTFPKSQTDRTSVVGNLIQQKQSKPGGKLNPNFVEFLMGYPMNWTKIDQAE
jgi:hypothetical protein